MTSHQLAIAKASLLAGLLRPDPISVSREELAKFDVLLKAVILKCSPENVQRCKQWTLENIYQSTARSSALGKYLTAFTASLGGPDRNKKTDARTKPSIKRQRLHILYLVNDILYHGKYRTEDSSICSKIQPSLTNLIGSCASFKGCPKHLSKIMNLILLWKEKGYFPNDYIDKLRTAVSKAEESGQHIEMSTESENKEEKMTLPKSTPYIMPASHGDLSTPWYDLPAGNLMPHIIPNSTRPINPDLIKPLQFVTGPADETLVSAVKKLQDDVEILFGGEQEKDEKLTSDIDELGQPIILDEITGEVIDGEGYYGWSRNFCERMRRRKTGSDRAGKNDHSGRSSKSTSSSPDVRKRRYSGSDESRDRSRRRRRSYSSSHSPSPSDQRSLSSRSRSISRSRPRSPARVEIATDPTQNGSTSKDELLQQSLAGSIPPFQNELNSSYLPHPPIPLPNMHPTGLAPFSTWPPPPIPFPINPNPQQLGTWLPPQFPPRPGQFQQHPAPYPFPGSGFWQNSQGGRGHQFG
ncbi:putative calcium homeostasis endoplasmic reticulum protein [Golovinomyces cichoracearum]|uniref:Putative calcium homeostasis endoplasmic reticulum protein n=1 Tax=Golovinomyces cichoracearum TaxID=62708 RepID=A0A420HMB9_9PEZI|nr:putative calcium homeostasis endoplasmic reticulum protein [Golovinomyces cichoracearum]